MVDDNLSRASILDSVIPVLWRVGSVVAGLVVVAAGLLYCVQDSLLYFPVIGGIPRHNRENPRGYRSPQERGLPFEENFVACEDGISIHSWLLLQPDSKPKRVPTVIFFHGNAGNIGLRVPNAVQMYQNLKCNVFMVEYRGYGDSDDCKPSEAGLKLDSEAALRFILQHPSIDPSRVFVFGRSLGGAVAFHLAHYAETQNLQLAGIIVENTFLSIAAMVDQLMPLVAPLKPLVLRIGWYSHKLAPHLSTPILYLAGAKDELVPHSHMLDLYQLSKSGASQIARIHIVKKGSHNDTWLQGGPEYWQRILQFFGESYAVESASYRSVSSLEDVPLDRQASVAVGMGGETKTTSIPIVPGNLMGIARAATNAALNKATKDKNSKTE